jgi:hypothetical protein
LIALAPRAGAANAHAALRHCCKLCQSGNNRRPTRPLFAAKGLSKKQQTIEKIVKKSIFCGLGRDLHLTIYLRCVLGYEKNCKSAR